MSKYLNQLMIALMLALLTAVYYWAKETTLDLITRGEGRLIVEGQNKLVQSPEGGVVTDIFVSDGDKVQTDNYWYLQLYRSRRIFRRNQCKEKQSTSKIIAIKCRIKKSTKSN